MAVDPLFEDEFGCEVEYVDDISEILPMYEVKYDIYLGNTSKFAFSGAIYMESIDDMVLKSDIVSELGFNFMHRINGIDIKAMNENMMIRYIKNDDNYTLTIDSYQYISESVRPFYYTTNTWDSNSCDGTLVHGLSSLAFDLMCTDNHIDVNRIYNAHNSSFVLYQVPISSFISNRIAVVDDWNLLYIEGILLNQVNDYLSVDVHSNGDLSTPSWLFEAKLPSYLVFESEELNQIKFVVPIIIESVPLSGDDDDSSFAIAFALTDSQSFVAVLLECEYQYNYNISDQVLCLPLFYPDGDSNTLGRMNPKYHSVHFMNWTWNDDYIDLLLSINTDEETNVELIIQNDPTQYSVSIELSIDSVSVQYRRDQNTGSFLGNRDLYFQFGHYTPSVLRYEVGAISMQRNQVMTNSFANNASDWALAILNTEACDDCIEMTDDSGVIAMNYLDLSLVLQWTYPDDAYFLNDHISSIKTVIQLDTSNNNQIFVFGDATNYILFTVGHLLHYSFYPQTESYIANVGDNDIFTDLEVFTSIISTKLSKINDYDIDNATVTAELIFECVNDPVNDMVQFKLYHADHEIVMEYKGSFESLNTLYLYFGAYSSNEVYTIESIHYEKLLTPNIEFVANIDSEDDLLRQIASTYSNPSTLVTALFANIISLDLGGNNSNGTNYWNLELSAAFDNCNDLQSNTTSHPRNPGYARVTVFEYNESISYREELFDISILQTECPSTIELYIEHPTYYNPLFYFNNCTNSTANENCTASNVHEIPFMIRWMDDKYSYIFKLHYFYGPYKPSSITYEVPHHIIEPRAAAFWLFEETSLLSLCLLLIVFGLCCTCCSCIDCKDCSCKWYLMRRSNIECIKDANRKCCCCVRCNSPSKGEYILDGSKIKRDVLDNVIFHHFDENAYHHLLSHSAAKYKEKIIGTKLSPFELSLYTMPAAFIVAITIVYTMAIFTDSAAFIDSFDDLFFNHAFTAFFAFLSAIILYILTILCIYLWFSKWKKVDFFSGEILQRRVSPALAKTDNAGKSGPIIRFFNELNKEQERETRAPTRTKSIWKKETEWRKESEKYEPNASFKFDKHCLFMVGDCCCRLLNAFIFTFSFWISFYAWYSHQEITVLYDVTNAIYALNSDTEHKMNIIQDWQDSEYDAMLNYYNLKVTQCNSKISINNERANAIMYNARQYHVDQMYPAITDLLLIESELRLKLDNILNGAELSEYAGEVDLIMDEIQTLSDNSINLVSDIVDTAENAIHSLCIATGVVSTGCSGGMINCGTIVSASCYAAAAHAISAIDSAVNEAIDALEDIKSTAVTPEIDESTSNVPNGTDTQDTIDSDTAYGDAQDADYDSQEMDSGDSGVLNTGERLSSGESLDFTEYKSLPIFNPFFWIAISDSIIIYYQIIMILKRMKQLHGGIEEEHDARKDIEASSKYKLFAIEITNCLNQLLMNIARILFIALPLMFICYAIYIAYNTTVELFEIDSVATLGLYQLYTAPVIAAQYKTNTLLYNQQQMYNQQLLPSLTNAMLININSISDNMDSFNAIQYENVSFYNQQKCEIQWSIASYADTYYCFEKYYNLNTTGESCQGCAQDIKAMCMVANDYVTKQFYGDEYEIFNGKMAEKRKYCQFDNGTNIFWHVTHDANSTKIITPNWDQSLTLQCPNGMIINSIHYIGSGDYKIKDDEMDNWNGIYEAYSYVYQLNHMPYNNAREQCLSIDSDLISIHSASTENEIKYILQIDGVNSGYFWIGLNDISNERIYAWTDGSSVDYTNYIWRQMQNERKCRWKRKIHGIKFCLGAYHDGVETDGILWTTHGWFDVSIHTHLPFLCKNPNVNFEGIAHLSSFMHSIDSIQCVEANRGPFLGCNDFIFSQYLFGDNNGPLSFSCTNAAALSGYNNTAWFLNGFIFSSDSGLLSSLKGIRCCYIPGTIFNINNQYLQPQSPSHLDTYGETVIVSNNSYEQLGIKSIHRGSDQSIAGFMFDSISDYIPRGCSTGSSVDCMMNRVDIVDYESFTSEKLNDNITANINTEQLICDEGCDANVTQQCATEYQQDMDQNNGNPNPFVTKFQCDNINFTAAVMDEYEQCEVYPVYPALFYDYDSEMHEAMVSDQLSPYVKAFGRCVIKLWHSFFIWITLKAFVFPLYWMISTFCADKCCAAVRKRHVAKVELVLKLNQNAVKEKHKKQAKYNQNKSVFLQMIKLNKNNKKTSIEHNESNEDDSNETHNKEYEYYYEYEDAQDQ
eukprot:1015583_1